MQGHSSSKEEEEEEYYRDTISDIFRYLQMAKGWQP